ncbi:MAG: hypothetical protein ACPGJR_15735 [Akkermansiaceae bacterium]|jgi:hypothetical protein
MSWPSLVQLQPVARPTVRGDFFRLPAWKRSLASVAYCLRCLEHWIAPQGWVREWVRLNILATVLVGTVVLLTGPVVTALLHNLFAWTHLGVGILIKIISMASILPPLVMSLLAGAFLWNIVRRRQGLRRTPHSNHAPYYE